MAAALQLALSHDQTGSDVGHAVCIQTVDRAVDLGTILCQGLVQASGPFKRGNADLVDAQVHLADKIFCSVLGVLHWGAAHAA